jgi:hypothetical protein
MQLWPSQDLSNDFLPRQMDLSASNMDITVTPGSTPESPIYRDSHGVRALAVAQITCYFSQFDAQVAMGLANAYRLIQPTLARNITWFRTEAQRRSRPIRPADLAAFLTWFEDGNVDREEYELVMGSGATPGESGPWGFDFALERSELPGVMGWFQISLPADIALNKASGFRDLALAIFNCLPWHNGVAGFGIQFDHGDVDPKRNSAVRLFALQHLGFDCNDLLSESELGIGLIKTVNWLTFLGAPLAHRAGLAIVPPTLVKGLELLSLAHGVAVQAGSSPCIGRRKSIEPELRCYAAADAMLHGVRATSIFPLPGFVDEGDTSDWLRRFERLDELPVSAKS